MSVSLKKEKRKPCCWDFKREEPELELVLTPESKYYGRWVCKYCKKFYSMCPNPKFDDLWNMRIKFIKEIPQEVLDKITDREKELLDSLVRIKNISPAQFQWFKAIKKKYDLVEEEIPDWKRKTRDASTDTSDLDIYISKCKIINPYKEFL